MKTNPIAFSAPVTAAPPAADPKPQAKPKPDASGPKPVPVPKPKHKPAPAPAPRPLPPPGPGKALSLSERLGTALYYGVQPPVYAYLSAAQAVQTSAILTGIAAMTPVIAAEQGIERGVASAYKYLHDPKSPDAPLQRAVGATGHLVGDGVAGGVDSVRSAYLQGGQGLITAAVSIPVSGLAALVGFGTLGVTVPLACLYGATRAEVKTPSEFFDEVRRGQHRLAN